MCHEPGSTQRVPTPHNLFLGPGSSHRGSGNGERGVPAPPCCWCHVGQRDQGAASTHLAVVPEMRTSSCLVKRPRSPPQKTGALFMLIRAEDAKQICLLLQLVPAQLPGTFPCKGRSPCGCGRIQHPERSCTNDNILAMFILLLQGGIYFFFICFQSPRAHVYFFCDEQSLQRWRGGASSMGVRVSPCLKGCD